LYTFLFSATQTTCPAHLILLRLIHTIILTLTLVYDKHVQMVIAVFQSYVYILETNYYTVSHVDCHSFNILQGNLIRSAICRTPDLNYRI
jgi:hypothetical protein